MASKTQKSSKSTKSTPSAGKTSKVISFHYTLTDGSGQMVSASKKGHPLTVLGGVDQILPTLEAALLKLKVGEKKKISIKEKDAFGPREQKRVIDVPLDQLPKKNVRIGDQFQADNQPPHAPPMTVVAVTDSHATLDGNHPLAGMDLNFDVELTDIRDATSEEISHGHVHGPGCEH